DARDAERGGGPLPIPAVLVEHAQDARALVDHQAGRGRLPPREQLGQLHALDAGEDEERLEHVLELAHVAGPGVLEERPQRAGGREREGGAMRAVEARDEVLDERRQVFAPLPERRERDREHAQAIVEVAAKLPRLDHAPEVAVGGGDDAEVDPPHAGGAERPHLPVLHDAQELRLERGREVLDLVEEERAAVGELQHAGALLYRAGERAARVPEELALGERLGDGGAVDRHEGTCGAAAEGVHGARHHLLAGAGLALDQHVGLGARGGAHQLPHLLHGRAPADQAGERVGGRAPGGARRAVPVTAHEPGGCASERGQVVVVGEHHVVRGARPQRRHRGCGKVTRADDQHRELGVVCTQRPHQLAAAVSVYYPRADDCERRRGLRHRPLDLRCARYAGVISTSRSPAATVAPATARTLVTRPATSAASVLSIFIASRTTSAWPTSTTWPSATSTETTFPGIGALTAP